MPRIYMSATIQLIAIEQEIIKLSSQTDRMMQSEFQAVQKAVTTIIEAGTMTNLWLHHLKSEDKLAARATRTSYNMAAAGRTIESLFDLLPILTTIRQVFVLQSERLRPPEVIQSVSTNGHFSTNKKDLISEQTTLKTETSWEELTRMKEKNSRTGKSGQERKNSIGNTEGRNHIEEENKNTNLVLTTPLEDRKGFEQQQLSDEVISVEKEAELRVEQPKSRENVDTGVAIPLVMPSQELAKGPDSAQEQLTIVDTDSSDLDSIESFGLSVSQSKITDSATSRSSYIYNAGNLVTRPQDTAHSVLESWLFMRRTTRPSHLVHRRDTELPGLAVKELDVKPIEHHRSDDLTAKQSPRYDSNKVEEDVKGLEGETHQLNIINEDDQPATAVLGDAIEQKLIASPNDDGSLPTRINPFESKMRKQSPHTRNPIYDRINPLPDMSRADFTRAPVVGSRMEPKLAPKQRQEQNRIAQRQFQKRKGKLTMRTIVVFSPAANR